MAWWAEANQLLYKGCRAQSITLGINILATAPVGGLPAEHGERQQERHKSGWHGCPEARIHQVLPVGVEHLLHRVRSSVPMTEISTERVTCFAGPHCGWAAQWPSYGAGVNTALAFPVYATILGPTPA